jgi:O-antigen/teichoic acid export membrane protein
MAQTLWYGALLTPAFVSQWIMVGCDKLVMNATLEDPEQAIGFYSVGERISSIVMFGNVAFALAWRRFAFHNMVVPGGEPLLARGMKLFVLGNALLALALSLLGDDLTHWLIRAVFEQGTVVIVPLTLAGWLAGLADTAPVGLHRVGRPAIISAVNVTAAALNVALNFWAIPRFGILGAAFTTLGSQALRAIAIWSASQRAYRLPFDYRGAGWGLTWMAAVFCVGYAAGAQCVRGLPAPWGWVAATASESAVVLVALLGMWWFPVFDDEERAAIGRWCRRAFGAGGPRGKRRS